MDWEIKPKQIPGMSGQHVFVTLTFPGNEHATIYHNECQRLEVGPMKFRDLYSKIGHTALLPVPARLQQHEFIGILDKQLKQVDLLIQRSKTFRAEAAPRISEPEPEFNFYEDDRFSHNWTVAPTGSGKTTYLSALINYDLDKVARGDASVMVIDSENEHLSKYLAHNQRFAPGGDLHGKLIYIEPDITHPLKLNIFDFERFQKLDPNERLERLGEVEEKLILFIGAAIGDTSGHMKNIISYCLRALSLIPTATVFTLKTLLEKDGFIRLAKQHSALTGLSHDTFNFLTKAMFADYAVSIGALRARLDAFSRNQFLEATFTHPQNAFHLYDLLEKPHVIIINTNVKRLRHEATELFGRFFIADILDVVTRRQDGGLPAYVFIDEAQHYIRDEPAVVELMRKARRQKVALTIAHHQLDDLSGQVRAAVHGSAIHARPSRHHPKWSIMVRQAPPIDVLPPPINFERDLQMTRPEWQAILDDMHARFCYDPTPVPPPTQPGTPPTPKRKQKFNTSTP